MMKIAALAGALTLALTTASFAQTAGPSGQQDTNKSGMANPDAAMARQGSPGSSTGASTTEPRMGTTGSNIGSGTSSSGGMMNNTPGSTTGPSGQTAK